MPLTVAMQMPDEERRRRLINGLKAGSDDSVLLNFSHLAQAIGMVEAEKYVETMTETQEIEPNSYKRNPSLHNHGMCVVNRAAALEACLRADAAFFESKKRELDRALKDDADKASISKAIGS